MAAGIAQAPGRKTLGIKTNATEESDLDDLVKATLDKFGKVTTLLNNVGWGEYTPLWEIDTREAGEPTPGNPVEGRECRVVEPWEGKMAGTPNPEPVSTRLQRIATVARALPGRCPGVRGFLRPGSMLGGGEAGEDVLELLDEVGDAARGPPHRQVEDLRCAGTWLP